MEAISRSAEAVVEAKPPKAYNLQQEDERQGAPLVHDESNWLISYADMMTLLMGFFVLMYAFSTRDVKKFTAVSKEVAKYFGGKIKDDPTLVKLAADLKEAMDEIGKDKVEVAFNQGEVSLSFDGALLFESGSATLRPEVAPTLNKISGLLAVQKGLDQVKVEGHTDSDPISSPTYPSNWELSSARSGTVVRQFISAGLRPESLVAEGFADSRPLAPEKDDKGTPLPENKAKNRRVVISVSFASNLNAAKAALDTKQFVPQPEQSAQTPDLPDRPEGSQAQNSQATDQLGAEMNGTDAQKVQLEAAKEKLKEREGQLRELEKQAQQKKQLDDIQKRIQDVEKRSAEKQTILHGVPVQPQKGVVDLKNGLKQLEQRTQVKKSSTDRLPTSLPQKSGVKPKPKPKPKKTR